MQVKDLNGCIGKDSIIVKEKQCTSGLYVPTAFTPNGDGLNDIFRPTLHGNVKQLTFTVYNRFGQLVFQTNNPGKGWDGKFGGILEESNVFVWICKYQFEGEESAIKKGTVLLIR